MKLIPTHVMWKNDGADCVRSIQLSCSSPHDLLDGRYESRDQIVVRLLLQLAAVEKISRV
jgi:hypothetical protein